MSMSITGVFPSSFGVGNFVTLSDSPQPAIRQETDSERKTESWDAHKSHIQEVIGEQHSVTGLECQVVIYTTRWLPRAAIETKPLRRFRRRQGRECRAQAAFLTPEDGCIYASLLYVTSVGLWHKPSHLWYSSTLYSFRVRCFGLTSAFLAFQAFPASPGDNNIPYS